MKTKLSALWHWLRSSFWFVPLVMIVLSIAAALICIQIDIAFGRKYFAGGVWINVGDIESARSVLSTIASSVITVAGVVFSITIAVLSQASSQLGPRLIWNFMHDLRNQLVLGTFVSTFMFCLVLLGAFNETNNGDFVPRFSMSLTFLLATANIGVLVLFIHHVSTSIQADNVVAAIFRDLQHSVARVYPEKTDQADEHNSDAPVEAAPSPRLVEEQGVAIRAIRSGYIAAISSETLLKIAVEHDLLIRTEYRPGHFVIQNSTLATVVPGGRGDTDLVEAINDAFITGPQRTFEQDVEFSIHQLVEIAVRALSPGINDPFTAIACINWISAALSDLARRRFPPSMRYDDEGKLRLVAAGFTFSGMVDAALHQIRQNARSNVAVSIHLLEAIAAIGRHVERDEDRAALERHALMIRRNGKTFSEESDRSDLEERYLRTAAALRRS